jgi:hypothetical protein
MLRKLLTCAASGLLVIGCAGAPSTPKPAPTAAANTNCVGPASASRLPPTNCGPGQSYTQEDIRTTGQTGAAGALQTLDPLVHH